MATTKQIISYHKELSKEVLNLCPSFAPESEKLSWDDYYEAKQKLRDFENKKWEQVK